MGIKGFHQQKFLQEYVEQKADNINIDVGKIQEKEDTIFCGSKRCCGYL